jgi:hypothetical protein
MPPSLSYIGSLGGGLIVEAHSSIAALGSIRLISQSLIVLILLVPPFLISSSLSCMGSSGGGLLIGAYSSIVVLGSIRLISLTFSIVGFSCSSVLGVISLELILISLSLLTRHMVWGHFSGDIEPKSLTILVHSLIILYLPICMLSSINSSKIIASISLFLLA